MAAKSGGPTSWVGEGTILEVEHSVFQFARPSHSQLHDFSPRPPQPTVSNLTSAGCQRNHMSEFVPFLPWTLRGTMILPNIDATPTQTTAFFPVPFEVNQRLEQCAEECIAKILRSLAVRNQDRSARPLDALRPLRF